MILNRYKHEKQESRKGIQSKFGRVLILQLLFISFATVLGVYAAAVVVERFMIGTALSNEARHYWEQLDINPQHPLPNTDNLHGYRVDNSGVDALPLALQNLPLGKSRVDLEGRRPIVYVEQRQERKLLLVFDEQSVRKLSFWFGVVPLSLTLMVIYLSTWFVYRQSTKTLSPLKSLAHKMRDFDLNSEQLDSLTFERWTGPKVDEEVSVLADALDDFTHQLKTLLARERAFSRDVSHELRTPLSVISGSLELLEKQGQLSAQQARVVERMRVTSKDMQSLIEILLVLAQSDYQGEESAVTDVNALAELLLEQTSLSHNSDQHVQMSLQQAAPLRVEAPSQVVGMVLANLLRNACNYTREGEVVAVIDQRGVRVADTGAGMSGSEIQRLQQPFQRNTDRTSGYGLGLDIVRRLCDRYAWTLTIESSSGQGTVVDVKMVSTP